MSVPIALCSLRLFGYMALTDRLAGDYRSQKRCSADKKRYPSGLVSDKTPTPFVWFWRQAVFCVAEACEDGYIPTKSNINPINSGTFMLILRR